jgi:AraC family transcriptional regulator, activator of mtrCDE
MRHKPLEVAGKAETCNQLASADPQRPYLTHGPESPTRAVNVHDLDHLLSLIDVNVEAFAVCEIGEQHSLHCDPHDEVLVHFVLSGEGALECEHGSYPLTAGMLMVVPSGMAKRLRGKGPITVHEGLEAKCPLQDGLVGFRSLTGGAELVLGCAILSATAGKDLRLFERVERPIIVSPDEAVVPLFNAMLVELRNPRVGTRAFVSALMKQILVVLVRSCEADESAGLLPAFDGRLASAVAAVLSRPQDGHTVDSLAATAGMSRARFCHHFSSAFRCSPKEFVRSVRLSSAAKLLNGSSLPVKAVAASVGYASRSYFSRAFQERYGVDPSTFREHTSKGSSQDAVL